MDSSSSYWPMQESAPHAQPIPHEQRPQQSVVDTWPKHRSPAHSVQAGALGMSSPTLSSSAIDMGDLSMLGELPVTGGLTFNQYPTSYYTSPFTTSYPTPWTTETPAQSFPLSTWSSLKGATQSSASPQAEPSQQPQTLATHTSSGSPPTSPMLLEQIFPGSTNNQLSFSSQPSNAQLPQSHLQPPPFRHYYQHSFSMYGTQQQQSQGTLSPQVLQASAPQTISPSVFYQPIQTPRTTQSPATANTQPSPPPDSATSGGSSTQNTPDIQPTEDAKNRLLSQIQPLLQPNAFTGAQAVNSLCNRIQEYGILEVDKATRLDMLSRIQNGAGNHYYRAWSENTLAMTITREWLKAAAKAGSAWLDTIMPLLQLVDRLPFTIETLTHAKLGKIIKALIKEEPSPAIKDMASNLERRWRELIATAQTDRRDVETKVVEDVKSKKRKDGPLSGSKPELVPPPKKGAAGLNTPVAIVRPALNAGVKKESKATTTAAAAAAAAAAAKDAKADSSFFSAPKAKAKLPSFKKAPIPPPSTATTGAAAVKKEDVAQPSSFDPFKDVLKGWKRKDSPSVSTPPPPTNTGNGNSSMSTTLKTKGKEPGKKKTVTWVDDEHLVSIRWIEKAIYDDGPVDGMQLSSHNLRDLDRGEGAALHTLLFEEVIDWSEPQLVEVPESDPPRSRGSASQEKMVQEEREQSALGALYPSLQMIPDSPAEPGVVLTEEEADKDMILMTTGREGESLFFNETQGVPANHMGAPPVIGGPPPLGVPLPTASVAELVQRLGGGGPMMMDGGPVPHANIPPSSSLVSPGMPGAPAPDFSGTAMQSVPAGDIHKLLQLLSAASPGSMPGMGPGPGPGLAPGPMGEWDGYDYGHNSGFHEDDGGRGRGRGRGGRGRGRGEGGSRYRRKPCMFFAQGRCKYGDQCDFSHEAVDHPGMPL